MGEQLIIIGNCRRAHFATRISGRGL